MYFDADLKISMQSEKFQTILQFLNHLLDERLSLSTLSEEFEQIAGILKKENLFISIKEVKSFYQDEELNRIYEAKLKAKNFEEANSLNLIEKQLLNEKRGDENAVLRKRDAFFKYNGSHFIAHLNKNNQNERLIMKLVETYNLLK